MASIFDVMDAYDFKQARVTMAELM